MRSGRFRRRWIAANGIGDFKFLARQLRLPGDSPTRQRNQSCSPDNLSSNEQENDGPQILFG